MVNKNNLSAKNGITTQIGLILDTIKRKVLEGLIFGG